ncbi:MAG: IS3 family transposase [Candidatus Competibacteraceae bacterium]|nr:IS3 family transposase [Candidatus Competibacteraceae bacterium]
MPNRRRSPRGTPRPNPEVTQKGARRRFTAAYKSDIVRQALACRESGEIGALLRREGLYSSHLSKWRAQYERGASQALADDTRGRKSTRNPLDEEVQRLRKQNLRLEHRLKQAEAIIEIQKKGLGNLGHPPGLDRRSRRDALMATVQDKGAEVAVAPLCAALDVPRASLYRTMARAAHPPAPREKPVVPRALDAHERGKVLDTLHEPRFVDLAPQQVYATLLDEGKYLCSVRTMYRILDEQDEVRERRDQRAHATYARPELLATRPNELWSWDITKLLGPVKWTYFHLYVILDVYSRYTVGWMIAHRESAELAKRLIAQMCAKQQIDRDQLTIHADRGSSMRSKPVALLLSDLGVTKTHSRPHVSNDNPFSESQFKTLKYRPSFPERFGSIEDARAFCITFFDWYNTQHHHTGIGLMTPEVVHYGNAPRVIAQRQDVLNLAHQSHPERFVRKAPKAPELPPAVWINPPAPHSSAAAAKEETPTPSLLLN